MAHPRRAVTPPRKVEGMLRQLDVAEKARAGVTREAAESGIATAWMEQTRLTATRTAAEALSAESRLAELPGAPSTVPLTRTVPSPVEAIFAPSIVPLQNSPDPSQSFGLFPHQTVSVTPTITQGIH